MDCRLSKDLDHKRIKRDTRTATEKRCNFASYLLAIHPIIIPYGHLVSAHHLAQELTSPASELAFYNVSS